MFSRLFRSTPWFAAGAFAVAALPALQTGEAPWVLELVFSLTFLVISLGIHEAAHALVAFWCGDSTAKDLGRITLNPIPHIDPFMTLLLPALMFTMSGGRMFFGGAKPVPVNFNRLRNPFRDMMFVALAGPASNVLLAVVFCLGFKVAVYLGHYEIDSLLPTVMVKSMQINLLLAAFNMLPIPPLDGSRVMTWLLPPPLRPGYIALERIGLLLVMGVWSLVPQVSMFVSNTMRQMGNIIDISTGGIW